MIIPKLIVFDFDGIFTDNAVYVLEDGKEMVRCSREDSLGINMLQSCNIPMFILSTEENEVVYKRGAKMKIEVFQSCLDKQGFLKTYICQNNIDPQDIMYVGNDINDLKAMQLVGFSVCPADAHETIKRHCNLVLSKKGGYGAVRELCELILKKLNNNTGYIPAS